MSVQIVVPAGRGGDLAAGASTAIAAPFFPRRWPRDVEADRTRATRADPRSHPDRIALPADPRRQPSSTGSVRGEPGAQPRDLGRHTGVCRAR
ncbi:hypothetical protein Asi03nite_37160 [Actinoplanes siamensis]|uniref:Uncharacterized protein n=1 Tax=Actinoplanes siamensis TaxID=1223317 RepID=A0A919N812_9ACTN|nr:hypothetical protein Asi03nite_37160 [Actinoplanes siamensis]